MKNNEKQAVLLKQKIEEFIPILTKQINICNQVFLIAHKNPDFDALASLEAMALICKKNKKASYIIIDDDYKNLPDDIISMIEKIKEKYIVLTKEDYENAKTNNDLLITLDVNKEYMTYLEEKYKQFKNIILIDHHVEDKNTINTINKLILSDVSSSSEILYYLLKKYGISADICCYTFLLAGIYLDTNKCSKNMYPSTYDAIKGLIEKGADQIKAEELFSLDFDSDRRVHRLVDLTHFNNIKAAIAIGEGEVYTKEEIAKAADYMLGYNCDVAIASGKGIDGRYFVSARSKNDSVAVNNIMYLLNNGGGTETRAACEPLFVDADKSDLENAKEIGQKIVKILLHRSLLDE